MFPSLVKFSGFSDSGKTSVIVGVIRVLKHQDLTIGVIKHDPEDHWRWEVADSDTGRFKQTGADAVALLSPNRIGLYQHRKETPRVRQLIKSFQPQPDVVLLEGFRSRDFPGFTWNETGWVDHQGNKFGKEDYSSIAARINEIRRSTSTEGQNDKNSRLYVDGLPVPLTQFPCKVMKNMLIGFLRSLNGVDPEESIKLEIDLSEAGTK